MINKLLDLYFRIPLLLDFILVALVWTMNTYLSFIAVSVRYVTMDNIYSSLIDTSISLAGFILAALTIIVTFKSNLKAKGINEAQNALELILASSNYKGIVRTFRGSILELALLAITLYCIWLLNDSCLLYTSPSPRDQRGSRMPSSA